MRSIIAASVVCVCFIGFWIPQSGSTAQEEEQLNSSIPPADEEKFKSIYDAKDWNNPYLIVHADGIEVISKALPSGRRLVEPGELRRVLIGLPVSAWPYGRVIAIQEAGLRAPGDDEPISRNKQAAEAVLKALRLQISWWPSA